jgi:hypothetical protein
MSPSGGALGTPMSVELSENAAIAAAHEPPRECFSDRGGAGCSLQGVPGNSSHDHRSILFCLWDDWLAASRALFKPLCALHQSQLLDCSAA